MLNEISSNNTELEEQQVLNVIPTVKKESKKESKIDDDFERDYRVCHSDSNN